MVVVLGWGCHPDSRADVDIIGECTACVLEFDTLWMSDVSDPNVVMLPVRTLEVGDSVLVVDNSNKRLVLFGPDGRTGRVIGGPGDGPGEFRTLYDARRLQDGSFMVLGRERITLLDEDLTVTAVRRPPVRARGRGMVPVGDSAVVVAGRRDSDEFSAPLQHLLSHTGELLRSYDTTSAALAGTILVSGAEGTVWLILEATPTEMPRYRLDQWDPATGRRLRSVERRPPWFEAFEPPADLGEPRPSESSRPWRPAVYDAFQSSEDVLWTLTVVGDPDYDLSPRVRSSPSFVDRVDVILEAVDPESGQLITGHRFDTFVAGFTPIGRLVVYEEDWIGRPILSLQAVSLVRERRAP